MKPLIHDVMKKRWATARNQSQGIVTQYIRSQNVQRK
jgi:hypothetical protein